MIKYKESGVGWIGQIPEDWEVDIIGNYFKNRKVKVSDKIKNVQKNVKNNFSNFTTRKLKDILITLSNSRKKGSNRYE